MSDPVTATIGLGLMGYGTVSSAMAQNQAGKDEEKARKAQAALIEAEAEQEARAYGEQAGLTREDKARLAARQNVLFAKSGVLAGTATPRIVREDSLARIESQARILQEKGWYSREFGRYSSELERWKGKQARRAGRLQAGATLATGIASMFMMASQMGWGGGNKGYTMMNPKTGYTGTIKQSQINKWLATP